MIKIEPVWIQTNYAKQVPYMGNVSQMEEEAMKAAKGGYHCLRNWARRRAINMNTARHLAKMPYVQRRD